MSQAEPETTTTPTPPQASPPTRGLYRFVPLLKPDPGAAKKLVAQNPQSLDVQSLENLLVVSVPETTSARAAVNVRDQLSEATGRDVVVVSHNIELLYIERVEDDEADEVLGERLDTTAGAL